MKPERYVDNREHRFSLFIHTDNDPILIVCPKCNSKALVLPSLDDRVKCICTKCTFNRQKSSKIRSFEWGK